VVNGTVALQLALEVMEIERGTEIFTPALTFVATPNAVVHAGAIPHFVDSDERTLGISAPRLREHIEKHHIYDTRGLINKSTGRKVTCVVPTHVFGHPVDMDPILEIAEEFNLLVIEDAAESMGSTYRGKHCGTIAQMGILSFNGNKIITTGGGGAILTKNKELAYRAKSLSSTAKLPHAYKFLHQEIAHNFRMPNINAALGLAQIGKLQSYLTKKRKLAEFYMEAFKNIDGISFIDEPDNCKSNFWLSSIMLGEKYIEDRDLILEYLNNEGLQCRPAWTLMHHLPMYASYPRADLKIAENLEKRIINLPSGPSIIPPC
jgi:perosamine synthetase